jgi:hypothetical protein
MMLPTSASLERRQYLTSFDSLLTQPSIVQQSGAQVKVSVHEEGNHIIF